MNKSNLNAFYTIANIAATSWYQHKCSYGGMPSWTKAERNRLTDDKAMTFRCPNFRHASGYIAFLFYLANVKPDTGATRRELCEAFKVKSVNFTMNTLLYAGFVTLDSEYTHKFTITQFGRAYLALAELARPELEILSLAKELKKV